MIVRVDLRNSHMVGNIIKEEGQNVYIDVQGTTYKFHQDQIEYLDPNKYYIIQEKQTPRGIKINRILPITRSTRKLGYKMIDDLKLPKLSAFHNLSKGVKYDGQWYYNCRKGSTFIQKG